MRNGFLRWLISTTALTSMLLVSDAARAQFVGPMTVTSTQTINNNATVDSTAGSFIVHTTGNGQIGFQILGGASVTVLPSTFGTSIITEGANAPAIAVQSAIHILSLQNLSITTFGAGSDGILLQQQGDNITAANLTVTTSGANASALAMTAAGGGQASTESFTNSTLASTLGPVIRVSGGGTNKFINLTSSTVTAAPDGQWLNVTGDGSVVNITASDATTLTGAAFTASNSTSNLVLSNGTVWNMTGSSNVTNLTNNASTIEFAPPVGGAFPDKTLTTTMNYVGVGGTLGLNTFLAADNSPSDKLVIGGSGSGSTVILVRNTGGPGVQTVSDGILVVQAISGGSTTPTAFSLAGGRVTAGAFDYFLFRGGVTPGTQDSWFLRDAIVAPPVTPPGTTPPGTTPAGTIPTPTPAPGTPPLPTPVPGAPPIPLYDPEVALKSVVPSVARTLGLVTLGTFNERQGDQLLLRGDDLRVGGWGRVFGQQTREHFAQGARPDFDGTFAGFQAGADLLRWESSNGHRDHIGFYVAEARASGSVHGSVDGFEGALAGHADLDAMSYAGYWTHLGPSNWYIDAVVQWTHIHGSPLSIRGVSNDIRGRELTGSIEAGYPIPLTPWLTFEPQIQGIWQRVSFDDTQEPFSTITFDRANVFTGRAGALLRGSFGSTGALWQPYLKGNVWWGSNGFDTVRFDAFPIQTGRNGGITLEGGGGVTGKLARNVSIYGDASYLSSVSGESRITLKGNVGLRVTW
jgi:outer membrane autotransporter protein